MVGSWTSDASSVAFHDQVATATTFDSTVWLLSTVEPSLREVVIEQNIVLLDVAIAPDGSEIALSAVSESGPARVHGVFTAQGSNEPKLLAEFEAEVIEWLPDGSSLLLTGLNDESAGLWRVDSSDGGVELVAPADDVLGQPRIVSVSDDGTWALVHYLRYVAREFPANVSHFGVVDLETGEVSALKAQGGGDFFGPMLAVFSPDGKRVAYAYHDGPNTDAPLTLAVRPTVGGQEQIISGDLFGDVGSPPTPDTLGLDPELRPVWTSNDRLVLSTRAWALVLDMD
jgi:WD40 repeat protein